MVLVGRRCRSGSAAAGPIEMISSGVRLLVALVFVAGAPRAMGNSVMGMRWTISQNTMGVAIMQGEPCRIMTHFSGPGMLALVVRGAGTSGRRPR